MKHEITIERFFASPPAVVYDAWVQPELLSQWMGPGNVVCKKVEADLKVGGHYQIQMQTDDGIMVAYGVYKIIEPNQTLAFTWRWRDTEMPESIVTLTFSDSKGGTDLRLHHALLPSEDSADHHTSGWSGSIEKLESFLHKG